MATKNDIIGWVNILALLAPILIILSALWLSSKQDYPCGGLKILPWPPMKALTPILIIMFGCALAGIVGGFRRIRCLLLLYFVAMLLVIIFLAVFTVWMYMNMVTRKSSGGGGDNGSGVDDYSGWIRRRVENVNRWERIRSCLSSSTVCSELNQKYRIAQDFLSAHDHLTPLQLGCCMPPQECGYSYVNPTYWFQPNNKEAGIDCVTWSNNQTQLCYSCYSCKAGLVANLSKEWTRVWLVLVLSFALLLGVYICACYCALKINRQDHSHKGNTNKETQGS